jgi:hypothetical protein
MVASAYPVSHLPSCDVATNGDHSTDKFMTRYFREASTKHIVLRKYLGVTYAASFNFDENLAIIRQFQLYFLDTQRSAQLIEDSLLVTLRKFHSDWL